MYFPGKFKQINYTTKKLRKMSNFSHVLFFTVIICFEAQLLVYCEETQLKDKYPWAVEEDEIQVENLVIEYAKKWKQKQSIISGGMYVHILQHYI